MAQGAIALVGDRVLGTSFAPPLDERSRFGFVSLLPAMRNVEPGSFFIELGCEGIEVRRVRRSLTVSTERPLWSGDGEPVDDRPAREDDRIAIGWDGFSLDVSRVLASLSAIAPFWLFSTVSIAGFTLPCVMSVVASPRVALAKAAFPPKLICLKNQFDGRGLSCSFELVAAESGGNPALLEGDWPRFGAGDRFGVVWTDCRLVLWSLERPRGRISECWLSAGALSLRFCRRRTSARGTPANTFPAKTSELLRGDWPSKPRVLVRET